MGWILIDIKLDGLEAVNKMNAGSKYDLVLMDIIMPNLDGVSACHLIRQFDTTPIVAMTSNIRSDDISMYFQHGKSFTRTNSRCSNQSAGMNDVLPKPFTKEGLMNMLEKHLAHLKKSVPDINAIGVAQAVQPLAHASMKQSLKDEDSPPGKSPASISTWNSPNQHVPGVSPVGSSVPDEYINNVQGHPGAYGIQPGLTPGIPFVSSPQTPMGVSRQNQHRRQISEISGGDELNNGVKRQQMYAPPLQQAQHPPMNPMQRPR